MSINILKSFDSDWTDLVNENNFIDYALAIFRLQFEQNAIYNAFVTAIGRNLDNVKQLTQIPFLPIDFFKTHQVTTGATLSVYDPIFESSGTTLTINSKHFIKNINIYKQSFLNTFKLFYGKPQSYVFLCLLPNYLERGNSSLVYMANHLINLSEHKESGFYLYDFKQLHKTIEAIKGRKKIILLGVTFSLLDFAEQYPADFSNIIVMETGGMKGRREEWTRDEVHTYLKKQWNLNAIHSEYGMTELLSQAYSKGSGLFKTPSFLKMMIRDLNDPLDVQLSGSGCINIIDLANIHSCSFIATDDLGRIHTDGSFEILGRMDNSALRGCSLMVV